MSRKKANKSDAYLRFLEAKIKGASAMRDLLIDLYVAQQLDCVQIGAMVQRDPTSIHHWLTKLEIPTRPRGSNHKQNLLQGQRVGFRHSEQSKEVIRAASIARGAVPYLRGGVHFNKGKRGAVVHNWKGGITPERQAFYRTDQWKHAVAFVWHREDAHCQQCGLDYRDVDRNTERFHIHHIVPFEVVELRTEPTNLALLCNPCHYFAHSKRNLLALFLACPLSPAVDVSEVAA